MPLTIMINGVSREIRPADSDATLLAALRARPGVTGPKPGCGEGACGACTVLIGRRRGGGLPAAGDRGGRAAGDHRRGAGRGRLPAPVQQAWLESGVMQCGYCTPGWLTAPRRC